MNKYHTSDRNLLEQAAAAMKYGDFNTASKICAGILERNPECPEALNMLGTSMAVTGRRVEAYKYLSKALETMPQNIRTLINLGGVCRDTGKDAEAEKHFRKVLEIDPISPKALYNLGNILRENGEIKEAAECFEKALKTDPAMTDAWIQLAGIKKYEKTDPVFKILESFLNRNIPVHSRASVSFALGRLYENIGDYEKSFGFYNSANEMKRRAQGGAFNIVEYEKLIDGLINTTGKDYFEKRADFGSKSSVPVFIVGMPRSGTTLVEQILCAHPDFHGAGELQWINGIFEDIRQQSVNFTPEEAAKIITSEMSKDYAGQYLDALQKFSPSSLRISDKLPGNFKHLWLIHLLFPEAAIIHCVREPLDTCLSCYFQDFGTEHPYTHDLMELGRFYQSYARLMEHWKNSIPVSIFEIKYEELTESPEKLIREALNFCGLEWDSSCMEFYKNRRSVKTASAVQVRQKIYKSSVGKWKNYEKFINPLIEILEGTR